MFEFGLLITAISWIIYLNKGSLSQGLITLSVLLFSYMLFSYGVIAGSIIEYFDWIKSIELLTFILFIGLLKKYIDHYLSGELGNNLMRFTFMLFPNKMLKLIVFFFIGVMLINVNFFVTFLIMYFIGKSFRMSNVYIYTFAYISILINSVINFKSDFPMSVVQVESVPEP